VAPQLTARQIDLDAMYLALKFYIFCCFCSDSFFPTYFRLAWDFEEITEIYFLALYSSAIVVALFGEQYYKTDMSEYFVHYYFYKPYFLNFFFKLFTFIIYMLLAYIYLFYRFLRVLFLIIKHFYVA
jgi:hypothetical protein